MPHDLVDFGGAFISLTSIHGVTNEIEGGEPTGNVFIDYGHGCRLAFAGDASDVMAIINDYCGVIASA